MALLTASQVTKWVPGIDAVHADLVADAIDEATSLAEEFCDRALEQSSHDEYTGGYYVEYLDVEGDTVTVLSLKAYPVTEIVSVYEAASETTPSELDSDEYRLDSAAGLLHRVDTEWYQGIRQVVVTYTGGYTATTLPAGLRRALLQLVAWVIHGRGDVGNQSDSSDGVSRTRLPMDGGIPADVASMLRPYRRMGVR